MTKITIDKDTKEDLLKIITKLQIQTKNELNYNNAIKFLISNFKKKNKVEFWKACKKINDIDINKVLDKLYLERKKDDFSP